jgi:hypothetical protein
MIPDPFQANRERVFQTAIDGPAVSSPALRRAAAAGTGLPEDLAPLVEKIRQHAYKVTDDDVARLQKAHGDDVMFEVIVSATLGAARERLDAGLRALEDA